MATEAYGKHKQFPHIEYVDLDNNGIAVEIVAIKRDKGNGDLFYIPVHELDSVDRSRIVSILRKRDAARYEMWDLLHNTTLGNGENALEYFHQLVKVKTASGQTLTPGMGRTGIAAGQPKRSPGRPPKQG